MDNPERQPHTGITKDKNNTPFDCPFRTSPVNVLSVIEQKIRKREERKNFEK
jgi:hypothetical protein